MLKIKEAIVVEGRYDRNTLSQLVDATIIETGGFSIRNHPEKLQLLRKVAEKSGLIVFTDSDGAGFVIRRFLKDAIPGQYLKHAYIPDIFGKEKRKTSPGKEGKLGVEGMRPEIILDALRKSGATIMEEQQQIGRDPVTTWDLYEWGLSGKPNSEEKRKQMKLKLGFPEHMSTKDMINALNLLYSKEELESICKDLEREHG